MTNGAQGWNSRVKDSGAQHLAEGLKSNRSLQELNLVSSISTPFLISFSHFLLRNQRIVSGMVRN